MATREDLARWKQLVAQHPAMQPASRTGKSSLSEQPTERELAYDEAGAPASAVVHGKHTPRGDRVADKDLAYVLWHVLEHLQQPIDHPKPRIQINWESPVVQVATVAVMSTLIAGGFGFGAGLGVGGWLVWAWRVHFG